MTTTSSTEPPKLCFADWHKPGLEPGDYSITVEQSVEAGKIPQERFSVTRHFSVAGPRFTLNAQEIQDVFPPPGSLGEHSHVLPHITLKRSTLPWERSANSASGNVPWLALLLFEEQEITERVLELSELKRQKFFPKVTPEKSDHDDDHVTVIDVPRNLLEQLMPTTEALRYLAHVRQNKGPEKEKKEEVAVLVGNRLPKPGALSIVHLVSLEERYSGDAFDYQGAPSANAIPLVSLKSWRFACVSAKQSFKGLLAHLNHQLLFHFPDTVTDLLITTLNTQGIPEDIRSAFAQSAQPLAASATVHEYSRWRITDRGNRYYLISDKLNVFNQAGRQVLKLDAAPTKQKLSDQKSIIDKFRAAKHALHEKATIEEQAEADHWWIKDGSNQYFVSQEKKSLSVYDPDLNGASTLRLPPLKATNGPANAVAEKYFKRGCVPLPHALRQGDQTISWYHGPLTPGGNKSKDIDLPIRAADELLLYNEGDGMFDVSYAAAWELGRLLTLQNTRVAVDLFNWKRAHAHEEQLQTAERFLAHLPYEKPKTDLELPQTVTAWFIDLSLLHGVPFPYLVPDERLLPLESIRFFCVDRRWIECLLDGAFSVGRAAPMDHQRDQNHSKSLLGKPHEIATGLLLRSQVVSGWPGLLVDGYADNKNEKMLTPLRMERLSKNVLLCLFAGTVTAVDIHQKPETLHFGFDRPDSSNSGSDYSKNKDDRKVPIDWRNRDKRVIDISTLAAKLRDKSKEPYQSAMFALDMIEGVEGVRFQLS